MTTSVVSKWLLLQHMLKFLFQRSESQVSFLVFSLLLIRRTVSYLICAWLKISFFFFFVELFTAIIYVISVKIVGFISAEPPPTLNVEEAEKSAGFFSFENDTEFKQRFIIWYIKLLVFLFHN